QIIDELEPERRGPYAGAVGYVGWGATNLDTAIAIRAALVLKDRVVVQAGAGIVADSDPAREFAETEAKAQAVLKALALAPPAGRGVAAVRVRRQTGRRHDRAPAAGEALGRRPGDRGRPSLGHVAPQGHRADARRAAREEAVAAAGDLQRAVEAAGARPAARQGGRLHVPDHERGPGLHPAARGQVGRARAAGLEGEDRLRRRVEARTAVDRAQG